MRKLVLVAAMAAIGSAHAAEPREAFWSDSNGVVVKDGQGNCLRTIFWTEKDGVCPGEKKPEPVAAPAPAPAPAAPAPTPIITKKTLTGGENFAFDSAKLTPKAQEEVAAIAAEAKALTTINSVTVEGHTDSTGPRAYNQKLSERRAETVRNELVNQGIPADKITTAGFAFDKPVASNATKEGRYQNRRVEITIDGSK